MGEEADGLHADIDSFCQRIAVNNVECRINPLAVFKAPVSSGVLVPQPGRLPRSHPSAYNTSIQKNDYIC